MPVVRRSGTSRSAWSRRPPRSPQPREAARRVEPDPARKPISPTSRRRTARAGCPRPARGSRPRGFESSPSATNTIAPTYAAPNTVHASVCHTALIHRRVTPVRTTAPTRPVAARRARDRLPVTAPPCPAVPSCRGRRDGAAEAVVRRPRPPQPARSPAATTALMTVGIANTTRRTSAGWIEPAARP